MRRWVRRRWPERLNGGISGSLPSLDQPCRELTILYVEVRRVQTPHDETGGHDVKGISWVLEMGEIDNGATSSRWKTCRDSQAGYEKETQREKAGCRGRVSGRALTTTELASGVKKTSTRLRRPTGSDCPCEADSVETVVQDERVDDAWVGRDRVRWKFSLSFQRQAVRSCSPPTLEPVAKKPMAVARRSRNQCETDETAGRKTMPQATW